MGNRSLPLRRALTPTYAALSTVPPWRPLGSLVLLCLHIPPQGCEYLVNNAFASQECDCMETMTLCAKLCVNEIVYGGEDILTRTIQEVKDLPISALFVLSACGPEIVGDDIVAVCEALQPEMKFRLVPIECAGFRGSQYDGIDIALDAILKKLIKDDV